MSELKSENPQLIRYVWKSGKWDDFSLVTSSSEWNSVGVDFFLLKRIMNALHLCNFLSSFVCCKLYENLSDRHSEWIANSLNVLPPLIQLSSLPREWSSDCCVIWNEIAINTNCRSLFGHQTQRERWALEILCCAVCLVWLNHSSQTEFISFSHFFLLCYTIWNTLWYILSTARQSNWISRKLKFNLFFHSLFSFFHPSSSPFGRPSSTENLHQTER